MGARWLVGIMMAVALPLTGCAGSDSVGSSGSSLAGTLWELAEFAPEQGTELVAVPDGVSATISFSEDQVSGSGGCNQFTGSYTTDGSSISIGPLATTLMGCLPEVAVVEAAYLMRLDEVTTYAIVEGTLTLSDDAGTVVLSYTESVPLPLEGTTWLATGINNGTGGVTSLIEGTTATAVFTDDATVSGEAGCNTFSGGFELDGEAITIGPLATTRMACADADLATQEANYLAALERVTTWTITRDRLELRDESGALQVSYAAQ
jgi:heat shock protein HslJ